MRERVGVLGMGRMGSAVARRLARAGYGVAVWDRDEAKARALAGDGLDAVASLGELGSSCEVVLASLADDAAVLQVAVGPDGVLAAMREGSVFVDLSTLAPETAREVAAAGAEHGVHVLDAAVSGSVPQVEEGKLVVLAGGPAETLERVRPLLEPLAAEIVHLGPSGAGATAKLAVNVLLGVGMQALAEAIALGERSGLERERLLDALARVAVLSPGHKAKLENVRRGEYPPAFPLRLMRKDFDLILEQAALVGLELPATGAAAQICAEAAAAAEADEDFSAVVRRTAER